jgi:abortive infection bacteriophage resistance protein
MCDIKPPLTFDQQLELMISRNLIVRNRKYALSKLMQINYYRLNGYSLTLRQGDYYLPDVEFEHIIKLYEFDKRLRALLLGILETIEVSFRTHIAYQHSQRYGAMGYRSPLNFNNPGYHMHFITKLNETINKHKDKPFVSHHIKRYQSQFPIWVTVELLSFGEISKLFNNLKIDDRKAISRVYNRIPEKYILSWLHYLTVLRNECAHYGRLYNSSFRKSPKLSTRDKELVVHRNSVFSGVFIINKLLLDQCTWLDFMINLEALLERYDDVVDLHFLGFPDNWQDILE